MPVFLKQKGAFLAYPFRNRGAVVYQVIRKGGKDLFCNVRQGMEIPMMNDIEVKGLSFQYEDGTEALKEIVFSVGAGERVAIIGANGAGKSTLLLHLNGLLPEKLTSKAPISIHGIPVDDANIHKIRSMVGLLFQDPDDQLFCPTVFEDVAFGPIQFGLPEKEVSDRVRRSLLKVGLNEYEKRHPYHLSRGEKRRVCLAGILACDAKVLVLDEPTSDLDPRTRRELKGILASIHSTQIIATHDLEFVVEHCPRTILLDKGKSIADGETAKLLSDEKLMIEHGLEVPHILRHNHPH